MDILTPSSQVKSGSKKSHCAFHRYSRPSSACTRTTYGHYSQQNLFHCLNLWKARTNRGR